MGATLLLHTASTSALDYRCTAGPDDAPFVELHGGYSVSYVRKGSFGYSRPRRRVRARRGLGA